VNISKIRKILTEEGIIFSFSGMISQDIISFILETARAQLEKSSQDSKATRSIFTIAIEQLQNILSYSKEKSIETTKGYTSPGVSIIGFHIKKKKYYVSSSNEINEEDKIKISGKIDYINSLDKQEQRKLLREKLKSAEDKHERGAGVGFIEMAKRSSEKIEYNFEEIDGKLYFHILAYV